MREHFRAHSISSTSRFIQEEKSLHKKALYWADKHRDTDDVARAAATELRSHSDTRFVVATSRTEKRTWLEGLAIERDLQTSRAPFLSVGTLVSAQRSAIVMRSILGEASVAHIAKNGVAQDGLWIATQWTGESTTDSATFSQMEQLETIGFRLDHNRKSITEEIRHLHHESVGNSYSHIKELSFMFATPELVAHLSQEEMAVRDWVREELRRGTISQEQFEAWVQLRIPKFDVSPFLKTAMIEFYNASLRAAFQALFGKSSNDQ